jgi:hypothetical protein
MYKRMQISMRIETMALLLFDMPSRILLSLWLYLHCGQHDFKPPAVETYLCMLSSSNKCRKEVYGHGTHVLDVYAMRVMQIHMRKQAANFTAGGG